MLRALLTTAAAVAALVNPAPPHAERVIHTTYLTGYSWWDNTPPGSPTIAYPRSDGWPTVHDSATGNGTYANPVTLAVGWVRSGSRETPDWPVGRRFYLPFLHKYVIVEDQCGDDAQYGPCHDLSEADPGATTWLDVWVDGRNRPRSVSDRCMDRITAIHTVVYQPKSTYPVNPGTITRACIDGRFYSERVPS